MYYSDITCLRLNLPPTAGVEAWDCESSKYGNAHHYSHRLFGFFENVYITRHVFCVHRCLSLGERLTTDVELRRAATFSDLVFSHSTHP